MLGALMSVESVLVVASRPSSACLSHHCTSRLQNNVVHVAAQFLGGGGAYEVVAHVNVKKNTKNAATTSPTPTCGNQSPA